MGCIINEISSYHICNDNDAPQSCGEYKHVATVNPFLGSAAEGEV